MNMNSLCSFIAAVALIHLIDFCECRGGASEEKDLEKLTPDCKENLPQCPGGKRPYAVYYHHDKGFQVLIKPNLNKLAKQQPDDGLYKSTNAFLQLKKSRVNDEMDVVEIQVKKSKRPMDFRRICFETFMVKSWEVKLYQQGASKKELIEKKHYMGFTTKGKYWFRFTKTPADRTVHDISDIKIVMHSEAPTFNIKHIVMFACVPEKLRRTG